MERLRKITLIILLGILGCGYGSESSQNETNGDSHGSSTHNFEEVAPGVYLATGKGPVNVGSNAMVVVNENDVVLVDSHITPDAARELIKSVKTLTDKPIHYLVNTHFHHDHAHGNQVFPEGVEIIGHEYTRERLLGDVLAESTFVTIAGPQYEQTQIAMLEKQVAEAEGDQKTSLESQLATLKRHTAALSELAPIPPNTTLKRKLTLYRGEREIQIHHLGKGHTGGDVIVFLPTERVIFTGDLLPATAPYLGDSWPEEFIETLEKLRSLDFATILPGHGPVIRDLSHIDFTQNYLRKYWGSVKSSHAKGLSIDEATAQFDMSGYENYAPFQLGRPEARRLEVVRMYQLLDGED
jgi:cyclase